METMTGDPVVEISGLTKSYGERLAVDELDLIVGRGEIFGILGSNGAGKTTSVECAQGLRRPDSGNVRVLGLDPIADRRRLRGRVGSQLQDSKLPDRMRVGEAMVLFAESSSEATALMAEWSLDDIAKVPFGELSGGQQQRLFLALALINRPEVVFLDELTQGLDPGARRTVWGLVERVRDRGATVVLVTHFMEEAEVLCDRVVVMTHGRAVDTGTPHELVERHGDGVRMRFSGAEADLEWLARVEGVREVGYSGTELVLRGTPVMIAHVGAALVSRGNVPDDIRVAQPDLESALLKLIEPIGA